MYVCGNCGAHLDYGERCDCEQREAENRKKREKAASLVRKNTEAYQKSLEEWQNA